MEVTRDQRFKRVVTDIEPTCPAALPIAEAGGGTGCRCRITRDNLLSVENPSALNRWCFGDYQGCGTWRADKEAAWERRDLVRELAGG